MFKGIKRGLKERINLDMKRYNVKHVDGTNLISRVKNKGVLG